jgi:hypothetical protein
MRTTLLSLFATFLIAVSFTTVPVSAAGSAVGETFVLSVEGFPDSAAAGTTVSGKISITLLDSIRAVTRQVSFTITSETPFGEAVLKSGTFTMTSGQTRTVSFTLPIAGDARPGTYTLRANATIVNETLSVDHAIDIAGKK